MECFFIDVMDADRVYVHRVIDVLFMSCRYAVQISME
jgi:hypothetical protein